MTVPPPTRWVVSMVALVGTVLLASCTIAAGDCPITIAGTKDPLSRGDAMPADAEILVPSADFDLSVTGVVEDSMGEPAITFTMRPGAAQRFEAYTRDHAGGFLLIALGDVVVSAPQIDEAIPGGVVLITAPGGDPNWIARFDRCLPVEVLGGG